MTAPDRIWAYDMWDGNVPRAGDWTDEQSEAPEGATEYVRADLADPAAIREAALMEALIWCSAASDFQEGGIAREGWLKLCAPLLKGAAK